MTREMRGLTLVALGVAVGLGACRDDPTNEGRGEVSNIVFEADLLFIPLDDTVTFQARPEDPYTAPVPKQLTWTSCDPTVVEVVGRAPVGPQELVDRVILYAAGEGIACLEARGSAVDSATVVVVPPGVSGTFSANDVPAGTIVTFNGTTSEVTEFDSETGITLNDFSTFVLSVTASSIEFVAPAGAGTTPLALEDIGAFDITLGTTASLTVLDADATEPDNDDPATGPVIALPTTFYHSFAGGDIDDWFNFTLTADATLEISLDWNVDKDLDFIVFNPDFSAADGSFDGAGCEGFFNHPEVGTCVLTAGDYIFLVEDFDAFASDDFDPVTYEVTITIAP